MSEDNRHHIPDEAPQSDARGDSWDGGCVHPYTFLNVLKWNYFTLIFKKVNIKIEKEPKNNEWIQIDYLHC